MAASIRALATDLRRNGRIVDGTPVASLPALLARAYKRPCFACGSRGECVHREPDVEMAIVEAQNKATERWVRSYA